MGKIQEGHKEQMKKYKVKIAQMNEQHTVTKR